MIWRWLWIAALAILAGSLFAVLRRSGGHRAAAGYRIFVHPGGDFTCELPAGWKADKPPYPEAAQAVFRPPTPEDAQGVRLSPSVWAVFYPAGKPPYSTPEDFVRESLRQALPLRTGLPEERESGGRHWKRLWVERPLSISVQGRRPTLRESYALLEARDGFFVLGLSLPVEEWAWEARRSELEAAFEHLVATFRPGRA